MQRVYSSIYVDALAQKKQSWWISTTACGDFQPKIFELKRKLRGQNNNISNVLDSQREQVSLRSD